MPEIGLVAFADVAIRISKRVLPAFASRFSKHTFTQPQLLAILCVMRFEDWTFREAEVRLTEHGELRRALGLTSVPDYTTLYRFMRRLKSSVLTDALEETVRALPAGTPTDRATVAVDATGLASGATSTFFVRRVRDHGGFPERKHWLKWLVAVDVGRRLIVAQQAHQGPCNDSATLRPIVDAAGRVLPFRRVLADAEFDSELNHRHVRKHHHAQSVIPAKRGKVGWRITGVRAQMRAHFPRKVYGQRSLIESVFSSIKRKLSARAPGRTIETQVTQALLLGVAYNLYRL